MNVFRDPKQNAHIAVPLEEGPNREISRARKMGPLDRQMIYRYSPLFPEIDAMMRAGGSPF